MQTIGIFLVACLGYSEYLTGKSMLTRPLVTGPLVGLVMGDVALGCKCGAAIELALMGAVGIGASIPPEVVSGGVLGTAFAISGHKDAGMAVALGLSIATLVMLFKNALLIIVAPLFMQRADIYAKEGDIKGVCRTHILTGVVGHFMILIILIVVSFQLGVGVVQQLLDHIPMFIQNGLTVASNILPALGFAILLQMMVNKKIVSFLMIGFVLTAYLQMPVLGVAMIASGIVLYMYMNGVTEEQEDDF